MNLEEMNIPNSVSFIDQMAFEYCSRLKSVHIPNSVTAIGNWAFIDCDVLSDVYSDIEDPSAINMGTYVFSGYNGGNEYTGRTLHVPAGSLEAYEADTNWSNFFEFIVEMANQGDINGDGNVTISDLTDLIDLLLCGSVSIDDNPAADMNGDGSVSISDVTAPKLFPYAFFKIDTPRACGPVCTLIAEPILYSLMAFSWILKPISASRITTSRRKLLASS